MKNKLTDQELEFQEKLNNYKPQEGHRKPMTRREFMAAGLIQGGSMFVLPTALGLLAREANAQVTGALANPPAYLEIHAHGGAAFMGQFIMTDANRNLLPTYNKSGHGSKAVTEANMTTLFGNRIPISKVSGLYKGLNNIIGADTTLLNQAALLTCATNVGADTASNPMSATGLIQSVISAGTFFPNLRTFKVINQPAYVVPPSPMVVNSLQNIFDAVAPRATDTFGGLPQNTRVSLLKLLKNLNASQIQRYLSRPGGAALKSNSESAVAKVETLTASAAVNFDPRKDAAFNAIWDAAIKDPKPVDAARNLTESGLIYALTQGYATSAGIWRTGYDYHNAPRAITDALDQALGELIGRVLLSFKVANRPVFIYVTSDGSCFADPSDAGGNEWMGDRNVNSVNFMIAYRPGKGVSITPMTNRPEPETQIGQFTASQDADLLHPVASSRAVAAAAYVNYMSFAGVDPLTHPATKQVLVPPQQLAMLNKIVRS